MACFLRTGEGGADSNKDGIFRVNSLDRRISWVLCTFGNTLLGDIYTRLQLSSNTNLLLTLPTNHSVDPFLKKEWYSLVAPSIFSKKDCGKTIITKTQGQKIASDGLKGRIVEVSLADLQENEDLSYRKIKLCIEDVQGFNCLLNFHGMDMTRDKICSLIKKRQTIIEASCDVKTTDGYMLRMFCIAFTQKNEKQIKNHCYAKSAQCKAIREKMVEYMGNMGREGDLKTLVKTLITAENGKDIEKECHMLFPIKECYIRKVKVLKKPKFDVTALMEWHTEEKAVTGATVTDTGEPVEGEETVAGAGGRY